ILLHEGHVALISSWLHRIVFIQIECDHVLEAQSLLFVEANEFFVYANRSSTRCQAQYRCLTLRLFVCDYSSDTMCHIDRSNVLIWINLNRNFLKPRFL